MKNLLFGTGATYRDCGGCYEPTYQGIYSEREGVSIYTISEAMYSEEFGKLLCDTFDYVRDTVERVGKEALDHLGVSLDSPIFKTDKYSDYFKLCSLYFKYNIPYAVEHGGDNLIIIKYLNPYKHQVREVSHHTHDVDGKLNPSVLFELYMYATTPLKELVVGVYDPISLFFPNYRMKYGVPVFDMEKFIENYEANLEMSGRLSEYNLEDARAAGVKYCIVTTPKVLELTNE